MTRIWTQDQELRVPTGNYTVDILQGRSLLRSAPLHVVAAGARLELP